VQLTDAVLEGLKLYADCLEKDRIPTFELKVLHMESFEVKARPALVIPEPQIVNSELTTPLPKVEPENNMSIEQESNSFVDMVPDSEKTESFKEVGSVVSGQSGFATINDKMQDLQINDSVTKKLITEKQIIAQANEIESPQIEAIKNINLFTKASGGFLPDRDQGNYNIALVVENDSIFKIDKSFHLKKLKGNCESPNSYNVPIVKPKAKKEFGIQLSMKGENVKSCWAIVNKQNDSEVMGNFVLFETVKCGIRLTTIDHLKFKKLNF